MEDERVIDLVAEVSCLSGIREEGITVLAVLLLNDDSDESSGFFSRCIFFGCR